MKLREIDKVELKYLKFEDYIEIKDIMKSAYHTVEDSYWDEESIKILLNKFPEGQVVIKVDDEIAGCALSIIVDYDKFDDDHTYRQITADYTFDSHNSKGDVLYGIDVFIKPDYRGLRLGRRLYDYRKELCEKMNLRSIVFGGRIPNYHKYALEYTPKEYIEKVKLKEIHDPVLSFQISNDFHPTRILKGYLEGDKASQEFAVLLEWDNIYYEKKVKEVSAQKKVVRLGLIQWQMRQYDNIESLMQQAEYFLDAVSGYRSDFSATFFQLFYLLQHKYNNRKYARNQRRTTL